jgi:NSS family neurotransmitter:Na+ symporter
MGGIGRVVGLMFFVALVVGALTSAISLLEVVVSAAVDGLGWGRHKAVGVAGLLVMALGAGAAWNLAVLDVMDQVANNIFLLAGGLLLAVFVGWAMPDPMSEIEQGAGRLHWFFGWRMLLRWVVPAVLIFVLWHSVPATVANLFALLRGD